MNEPLYPRKAGWAGVAGVALVAIAVLLLAGCTGDVRDRALFYADINRVHAADETLPRQAREIAEDNEAAWAVQAWRLGGPEPSAEIVARVGAE